MRMVELKFKKEDLILSWIFIYMISKMLWDQVPVIFEGTFFLIIVWQTWNFFCIRKKFKIYRSDKEILLFLLLSIYIVVNGFIQNSANEFFRAIYEYIFYVFPMYAFIHYRDKVNLQRCLKAVAAVGCVISALSWYEYVTRHYLLKDLSGTGTILNVATYGFRAAVFTRSYISHGMVLGILCLIGYHLWLQTMQKRWLLSAGFAFVSILTTGSRGPMVSISLAIVVAYFLHVFYVNPTRRKKINFMLLLVAIVVAALIIFTFPVTSVDSFITYSIYRVQSIFNWVGDAGNVGRLEKWKEAVENWFFPSPLWGIGPSKTGSWSPTTLGVTESGVLRRLCEFGIMGAGLYYGFVFAIVRKSVKYMKWLSAEEKREMVLWMSICVAIFVNDITVQTTEEIMVSFWWWIALGGIYGLKNHAKIEKEKRKVRIEKDTVYYECGLELDKTAAALHSREAW